MILRRCLCGAGIHVHPTPDGKTEAIVAQFDRRHRGDGHGPAQTGQHEKHPTTREDRP